jgi:hypothetical protein
MQHASINQPGGGWNHVSAGRIDDDVQRLIAFIDDSVTQGERRRDSLAARAAAELHRLAERLHFSFTSAKPTTPPAA